jgi:TolB-like protein
MINKTCTITRKIPRVKQIGSRLSVAIFPSTEKKKANKSLRNYVQTFLTYSFSDQKRFNVVKRDQLASVMEEEKTSRESLLDQETALRLGRHLGSETVLTGNIRASEASIEILAHLIDTKTSSILAEKDIYWEGELTAGFRGVLDALALKFKQQIPLCEGNVTQTMPDDVIIDLGTNRAIQQGMKFLAFREGETLIDYETGMDLGSETDIIGLLSAKDVDQTFSKADVVKKFTGHAIEAGTRVITK